MTLQLWEHWSRISNQEKLKELCIYLLMMLIFLIIAILLDYIKVKYEYKVNKSNSKILKFIFKHIM